MTLLRSKGMEHIDIVLHVNTTAVTGAVVSSVKDANGKVKIYAFVQNNFAFKKSNSTDFLTESMLNSVKAVAQALSQQELPRLKKEKGLDTSIRRVHYVLASPWSLSQSKTVTYNYTTPTKVGKDTISKILNQEKEAFTKGLHDTEDKSGEKKTKAEKAQDNDIYAYEQKVIDIKCNNYSVSQVTNALVYRLDVSCLISITSSDVLKKIEDAIHSMIHPKREDAHSSLLLDFGAIRTASLNEDYALIRIFGEMTDILIIRSGLLIHSSSFAFGVHTLIRTIANGQKVPIPVAYSYFTGKEHSSVTPASQLAIENSLKEWSNLFSGVIQGINQTIALPFTIQITTEHDFQGVFKDAISNIYKEHSVIDANYSSAITGVSIESPTQPDNITLACVYSIASLQENS